MSDVSMGEGWWQASNGRWYPPEKHPDARRQSVTAGAPGWVPPTEVGTPVASAGTWTGARTGYGPTAVVRRRRPAIVALIVVLVVLALAVAGWVAWRVLQSDDAASDNASNTAASVVVATDLNRTSGGGRPRR